MLRAGDTISLTIDRPAAGGSMIARVNGQVVLVSGAIPGERVVARIDKVAKGVAHATAERIEDASPDRRASFADPLCGGCLYNHIDYPRQLAIKSDVIADAFKRIGRITLPGAVTVAASPEDGYRTRARLHVRGRQVGFFREGTHDVCDARLTRQLLPATLGALEQLAEELSSLGVDAREIELAENADASDRVVSLEAVSPIEAAALDRLSANAGFSGVVSAFGERGRAHVIDRLALNGGQSIGLQRHVHSFFQGNRHLLHALVQHVVDRTPDPGEVIDLYGGVGLFATAVAAVRGVRVTAVESDRIAAADLQANAAATDGRVVAVHQSVEQFVAGTRHQAGDFSVIVDPPRTGMSREALDGLLRLAPSQMTYVSCDVATLARDARRVVDAGYAIERADAFDLFPNTPHVETVVVFRQA
jgi:23S rRNA (uracil1939-C5)-methyltransferase